MGSRTHENQTSSVGLGCEVRRCEGDAKLSAWGDMAGMRLLSHLDDRPGVLIVVKGVKHLGIQAMATAGRPVEPKKRRTGKSEIANRVHGLVADEFVAVAESFDVEDPVVSDCHSVFERCAERAPSRPKLLHVLHEAESAGATELLFEGPGRHIHIE